MKGLNQGYDSAANGIFEGLKKDIFPGAPVSMVVRGLDNPRILRPPATVLTERGGTYVPGLHRKHSPSGRRSRIERRNSGRLHWQVQQNFQSISFRFV